MFFVTSVAVLTFRIKHLIEHVKRNRKVRFSRAHFTSSVTDYHCGVSVGFQLSAITR